MLSTLDMHVAVAGRISRRGMIELIGVPVIYCVSCHKPPLLKARLRAMEGFAYECDFSDDPSIPDDQIKLVLINSQFRSCYDLALAKAQELNVPLVAYTWEARHVSALR